MKHRSHSFGCVGSRSRLPTLYILPQVVWILFHFVFPPLVSESRIHTWACFLHACMPSCHLSITWVKKMNMLILSLESAEVLQPTQRTPRRGADESSKFDEGRIPQSNTPLSSRFPGIWSVGLSNGDYSPCHGPHGTLDNGWCILGDGMHQQHASVPTHAGWTATLETVPWHLVPDPGLDGRIVCLCPSALPPPNTHHLVEYGLHLEGNLSCVFCVPFLNRATWHGLSSCSYTPSCPVAPSRSPNPRPQPRHHTPPADTPRWPRSDPSLLRSGPRGSRVSCAPVAPSFVQDTPSLGRVATCCASFVASTLHVRVKDSLYVLAPHLKGKTRRKSARIGPVARECEPTGGDGVLFCCFGCGR